MSKYKFVFLILDNLINDQNVVFIIKQNYLNKMCVNDYEFRHYSATRPKQCRRFIIKDEFDIQKSFLVNISQFQENGQVALCKILFYLGTKGLSISNRSFFMQKYEISIKPGDYCVVPFEALSDKDIIFNSYKNDLTSISQVNTIQDQTEMKDQMTHQLWIKEEEQNQIQLESAICCNWKEEELQQMEIQMNKQLQNQGIQMNKQKQDNRLTRHQQNHQTQSHQSRSCLKQVCACVHQKRIKQPQRKIGQVILSLKKWRLLYQSKRLNLTKSAKLLGISKKSLDDYYLVIRVGQILQFDFAANLNNKMGDLRNYIRGFDYKVKGKLGNQVACFTLVAQVDIQALVHEYQLHHKGLNAEDQHDKSQE